MDQVKSMAAICYHGRLAGVRSMDSIGSFQLEHKFSRVALGLEANISNRSDDVGIQMGALASQRAAIPIALNDAVRRARDVTICLLLLMLTTPLLLVVVCLIKLDSRGPLLYRQDRVGLNGRVFTLLKFRSMQIEAEADGPRWAAKCDPRVTRVGGFIRGFRIDELPQLLNVLRGDMSLIGPRPERPCFAERLSHVIPQFDDRTGVLPGITGWAQVNYQYGASVEDARIKLTYDLHYIRHQTQLLDLRILVATVRVVVLRIGAR